jgi:hypothetical protein
MMKSRDESLPFRKGHLCPRNDVLEGYIALHDQQTLQAYKDANRILQSLSPPRLLEFFDNYASLKICQPTILQCTGQLFLWVGYDLFQSLYLHWPTFVRGPRNNAP